MSIPNPHIRIAGLGVDWPKGFAWTYKEKLYEIGFCSKVISNNNKEYVAYSHRDFTKGEADDVLNYLLDRANDEYFNDG